MGLEAAIEVFEEIEGPLPWQWLVVSGQWPVASKSKEMKRPGASRMSTSFFKSAGTRTIPDCGPLIQPDFASPAASWAVGLGLPFTNCKKC